MKILGGYFIKLQLSDLPPQFEHIAMKLGLNLMIMVFEEFGGTSVYFPTVKMIYKDAMDREIVLQYNGFNYKDNVSEKLHT